MKAKKKNKFLTFCFSCFPGAGEMYMGFMKMGVSLMMLFMLAVIVPSVLRLDVLIPFAVVIWFYGFFHANHLRALSDEEFEQVEDVYLLGMDAITGGKNFVKKYQKWVAGMLILAGIMLLWNSATDLAFTMFPAFYEPMHMIGNYVPRVLVAVIIIVAGIGMIGGKKVQFAMYEEQVQASDVAKEVMSVTGKTQKNEEGREDAGESKSEADAIPADGRKEA